MSSPLVSLVVPNMNNGPALDLFFRTLERNTTYRNVEVVVADDGSTDTSLQVLRRWRASGRFPSFTLIEREHSGIVDTLNEALAARLPEVTFVGRLARYQYLNMDQVVGQALSAFAKVAARVYV